MGGWMTGTRLGQSTHMHMIVRDESCRGGSDPTALSDSKKFLCSHKCPPAWRFYSGEPGLPTHVFVRTQHGQNFD